jgi:hypothetical protein
MPALPEPLERLEFNADALVREHPPVLRHSNKLVVYSVACPEGSAHAGTIVYTRWPAMALPERVTPGTILGHVKPRHAIYQYERPEDMPDSVEWYVNFADPLLFYAYGSGLFAQDEMQTAEHPAVGSLVEALHVGPHRAVTEDESGPTPVLVTGVERRCVVAIDHNEAAGRPRGLYGNEFSAAPQEVVKRATTRIEPPTVTNIIALAAPSYGVGPYTRETIERILITAYTGFAAAKDESARIASGRPIVIDTGYWGCGVFGGNRVLMSLLQLLAAGMVGVDRLVFHTIGPEGAAPFEEALRILEGDFAPLGEITSAELVDRVVTRGFMWGMNDIR